MPDPTSYARFLGQVVAAPPCRMLNANMYGFFIQGEIGKIQAYLDTTLNRVSSGQDKFVAILSYCMLTFTDIENIKPTSEPYVNQGWFQETDIIIWLPVMRICAGLFPKFYWYPAFICVNNIYALINGREIWGFNKYLCDYKMPFPGADPDFFSITVDAFPCYSPNTRMQPVELFRVKKTLNGDKKPLSDFSHLVREGFEQLKKRESFIDKLSIPELQKRIDAFFHPELDQILFKQFPGGEAKEATYQQVVHSLSVVQDLHSLDLYFDTFEFTLNQVDMFPLQEMFGIPLGSQDSIFSFNALFDFDQHAAFGLSGGKP
jgi:hypothetical protein